MRLHDVHAHLADPRLTAGLDAALAEADAAGVAGILACAARLGEWPRIVELSRRPPVHGALGLHPFFVDEAPPDLAPRLRAALAAHDRIAAVGEIGLDFQEGRGNAPLQLQVFIDQLLVAQDMELPVVLHNRHSWGDFLGVLRDLRLERLRGVCHCFNGSREVARAVLDRGLMVSFCGPLTYPSARRLREAAAYVPLDAILTETDCPDLPPQAVAGGLSLPHHVRYVVEAIAAVKGLSLAAVAAQVEANYRALLRLS